ncbi:MAG: carbohydrate ABC transporter permease [Clostridiaceae bacterium]|nr:carbohydrate ABC transporter permease [Clostridiaceae bacterium]
MVLNRTKGTPKFNLRIQAWHIPGYIILGLWCAFIFIMLGWIVLAAFSTTREIFTDKLLSTGIHFENFVKVIKQGHMFTAFLNSMIYSGVSVALSIIICAPAAFGLSRFDFKFKGTIQKLLVVGLGVPAVMIIMPLFYIVSVLRLGDTKVMLIILYVVTSIPFNVFYLMPCFSDISPTYEEAAAIDGCGPFRTFWTIIFPLAGSTVTTLVIFQFIGKWNENFMAMIFASSTKNMSLSVALYQFIVAMTREGGWSGMFAAVTFVSAPTIILYILLSRKIIGGVTAGGLKG